MSWLKGEWSSTFPVLRPDAAAAWYENFQDGPGVYRLVARETAGSMAPVPINRVCGVDSRGTIYIGCGSSLKRRLGQLVMQHDPGYLTKTSHKPLSTKLASVFPPERLGLSWQTLPYLADHKAAERDLLTAYRNEFGEHPPLNGQSWPRE